LIKPLRIRIAFVPIERTSLDGPFDWLESQTD
jgi:hypothetical protein